LKIAVSVVRFRPWAPFLFSSRYRDLRSLRSRRGAETSATAIRPCEPCGFDGVPESRTICPQQSCPCKPTSGVVRHARPSPGDAADQFGFVSDPGGEQGDEIARELEPLLFGRKPACGLIEERFQKRDVLGGEVGTGKNLAQRHGFLLFGAKARSSLTAASALYTAGDETPSVTISRMASHFMFQGYLEEPISGGCE